MSDISSVLQEVQTISTLHPTRTKNCNYGIDATFYTPETWFLSGILL